MNSKLVKLLHPKTCVRVLIADRDHRMRGFYVVPKGNIIPVNGRDYIITNDSPIMMSGKQPCFVFANDRLKPLDLYAENGPESAKRDDTSPEDLKTILSSKFMTDLAHSSMGKNIMMYVVIGAAVLIGGFYMLFQKMQEQGEAIAALRDLINTIIGA